MKKQRGDGEPSALMVNQKQRVNTCHIFLMESGTNTVKQTRRDAASVVISRSFTINIPRRPFHAPLLLRLILSRRDCDSWIRLSKHSTVTDLSRASTYRLSNTIVTLCHPDRPQLHTLTSVFHHKYQYYKEYLRISAIHTRFRPTSSPERKRC